MLSIGFIGFGEAASQISLGLSEKKIVSVNAYDIMLSDPAKRLPLEDKALKYNVSLSDTLQDLASKSEIIFSAVTSSVAYQVADEIIPYLSDKHTFVDLNAITPEKAKNISSIIEKTGAAFIDGAMVGSLKALKHKVPILLSGKRLNLFTEKMEPLGFNLNVVGEQAGMASGNKLIRSVFTKGLAALLIETLVYAKKLGYYEVVLESIIKTLKADPADLIGRLISGTMLHSHRRIGELSGSKEMLDDAGLDSRMIEAAMEVLKNVDSFDFDKETITVNISASIEELDSYYK